MKLLKSGVVIHLWAFGTQQQVWHRVGASWRFADEMNE